MLPNAVFAADVRSLIVCLEKTANWVIVVSGLSIRKYDNPREQTVISVMRCRKRQLITRRTSKQKMRNSAVA